MIIASSHHMRKINQAGSVQFVRWQTAWRRPPRLLLPAWVNRCHSCWLMADNQIETRCWLKALLCGGGEGPQEIARFNQYWSQGWLLLFFVFFMLLFFFFFQRIWPSDLLAPEASLWHLSPSLNSCTSCIYRRPLWDISIWMAEALRLLRAEARIGSNHTAATIATPPNTLTSLKIQSSPVSTSRLKLGQKHLLQTVEGSCRKVVDGLFN